MGCPDTLDAPSADPDGADILGTGMNLQTLDQLNTAYPPCNYIFRFAITRDAGGKRTRLWFSHYTDSGTCVWVEFVNGGV